MVSSSISPQGAPRAVLHVCTTCKRIGGQDEEPASDTPRPGARMFAALVVLPLPVGVALQPVECLSACSRGCSVALSAPGKWTYLYGDMDPDRHAPDILRGAELYARSADGLTPWRERPEIFRKQSVGRVPPLKDAAHGSA